MELFKYIQEMGHEQVIFCHDPEAGLKAIIAIHNTNLGPAMGGTRLWPYTTEEDALRRCDSKRTKNNAGRIIIII